MEQEILTLCLQFGGTFALAVITIYLLIKNRKKETINGTGKAILTELKTQNENHLHSMERGINEGFDSVVKAINDGNIKIIELLGRIDGKLSK